MTRPWKTLDSVQTDQGRLDLRRRGETDFLITIGGRVLMNASASLSEIALARLACEPLAGRRRSRVMVGGLGMGITLKAALAHLGPDAEVVVVELNPVMVDWCRGPLAELNARALDDPRVTVVVDDVARQIRLATQKNERRYDAILLDLYEGPGGAHPDLTEPLYGDAALEICRSALSPRGILAVWGEDPDKAFERRLKAARFVVDCQRPGRGGRHVVYIARKAAGPPKNAAGRRGSRPRGR